MLALTHVIRQFEQGRCCAYWCSAERCTVLLSSVETLHTSPTGWGCVC